MNRKTVALSLICGVIFAVGLSLSGMTQPKKVLAFLDLFGRWDASLMFVMIGAIAVYSVGYPLLTSKKRKPRFEKKFEIPEKKKIDKDLVVGSAIFGVGWGLAGFCPGPAIVNLASLHWAPLFFCVAMLAGMSLYEFRRRS